MNTVIQPKKATPLFVVSFLFACFAFSSAPNAFGVSPPPDGSYPGGNTAEGFNALFHLSPQDGGFNTAVGAFSLFTNATGSFNTAVGAGALDLNTGHNNTAVGAAALLLNTTGTGNVAVGTDALVFNSTGDGNTATGAAALLSNTLGSGNTAVGAQALQNISGSQGSTSQNTAVGQGALQSITSGSANTAVGAVALTSKTSGDLNTAIGTNALGTNTTGSNNIAVGNGAGSVLTTGDNNIDIDNAGGAADEANTIRIGTSGTQTATFIAGISGATASGGAAVFVDTDGQLGTMTSSARFKDAIKPMDKASTAILALKPVTFRYKKGIDPQGIPQFGLVAEEVEKVNPDLVVRDKEGKPYTVRYEAVNAMLLNEFLKEHKAFLEEHRTVEELKKQIEALTAGLQKVRAQLELSKSAPQTVLNKQ